MCFILSHDKVESNIAFSWVKLEMNDLFWCHIRWSNLSSRFYKQHLAEKMINSLCISIVLITISMSRHYLVEIGAGIEENGKDYASEETKCLPGQPCDQCGGHKEGEGYEMGCNKCVCTAQGAMCTMIGCNYTLVPHPGLGIVDFHNFGWLLLGSYV